MISRKSIKDELMGLGALQNIVESYEEIASIRMKKIKTSVLKNRDFLSGLNNIYARIRYSYKNEIDKLEKRSALGIRSSLGVKFKPRKYVSIAEDYTQIPREVVVLLSANAGLFGDIVRKTYQDFGSYIKDIDADIVIVGTLGKQMYEASMEIEDKIGQKSYQFFSLTDNLMNDADMKLIVDYVKKYEKVTVFHGEFQDILKQVPVKDILTGEPPNTDFFEKSDTVSCFFEPSLNEVLGFFRTHIMSALFSQSVYESSLSKYTSRMISLDKATENISNRIDKVNLMKQVMEHREYNKRQANTLSGIYLWSSIR